MFNRNCNCGDCKLIVKLQTRPTSKLSDPPLKIGSDYSRHPMPGQLALDTRQAGERSIRSTSLPITLSDLIQTHGHCGQ